MKKLFTLLFCLASYLASAQKENNFWFFGDSAALDFNSGVPVAVANGVMNQVEGCAAISDTGGNLLFYTDGVTVWDRNDAAMPNGHLNNHAASASQSSVIVPFINNTNLYYLFTVDQNAPAPGYFRFSVVDMSLNGGNGDVTVKDSILTSPVGEKICAVEHANHSDVWVMVHQKSSNNFLAYLVTAAGIAATPVISGVGQAIPSLDVGYMKFSHDGTKIAFAEMSPNYIDLFDFDNATGMVSDEKNLPLPGGGNAYGLEFSPNGNYLYGTQLSGQFIFQWDISSDTASVINSTQQLAGITSAMQTGAMQLGPDGKIYVSLDGLSSLGVIHYPDSTGTACSYADTSISLGTASCKLGLPNFVVRPALPTGLSTLPAEDAGIRIYPNPTSGLTTIWLANCLTNKFRIKVSDLAGRTVFEKEATTAWQGDHFTVDLSHLAKGTYILSFDGGENKIQGRIILD